jgi:dephospho-CoA kinase
VEKADLKAHALMTPGKPAWKAIVAHFGSSILNPDKTINRKKLGSIIFSRPEERKFLDDLIHPLVIKAKESEILRLGRQGKFKIFVSEAALTIESGFHPFFDRVIVVFCEPDVQITRLMERDAIGREEALMRIGSQMPQEEKLAFADYRINTSGSPEETIEQTEGVFRLLMQDYQLKAGEERL